MTPIQIASFRAHAQTAAYRRKLATLRETIAALDPARTYVSFSAGKDSSVIAHACHAAHPGIPILMVDPGCPTHWTEDDRVRWLAYAGEHGWRLTLFPWDKWGLQLDGAAGQDYRDRIHRSMFADLEDNARAYGLDCRVMGMRAEESTRRRILVARLGDAYAYVGGGSAALPIARWSTMDVWAYVVTHSLPWLSIYDALGPQARNGMIGRNGERFGREEYLRQHFPDIWRWAKARNIF